MSFAVAVTQKYTRVYNKWQNKIKYYLQDQV